MTEAILYHAGFDGERYVFAPAANAVELTEHQRRNHIASALRDKLAAFHERVTGPRQRVACDLTHNTVDAARSVYQTLATVSPEAAAEFKATYGAPSSWTYGPVVDPQGWLCRGLYHERVLDDEGVPVSPSAYRSPALHQPAFETERQRLLRKATDLRRQADLIDPAGSEF
jgi:hypothetical protein